MRKLKSDNIFELEKMIEFKKRELGEVFYDAISSSDDPDTFKVMEVSADIKELEERLQLLKAEEEGGKRLFCKGCGSSLYPQSSFCSNCGMSIHEQAESIPPVSAAGDKQGETGIPAQTSPEIIEERKAQPMPVQACQEEMFTSMPPPPPPRRTDVENEAVAGKPAGQSRSSKSAKPAGKPPKKRLLKRPLFWVFVVIVLYLAAVFITNVRYMYFFPI